MARRRERRPAHAVGLAMLLAVGGALSLVSPAPARAATFNPVADAWVDAGAPGSNFGGTTTLRVDGDPVRTAYLKFSVTGATTPPSASLRLFFSSSSSGRIDVYEVSNTAWAEREITASNAPPLGALLDSVPRITAGQWYEFDVSSAVGADGLVTLAVRTPHTTAVAFHSREGTNKPELLVPAPDAPPPAGDPTHFTVSASGSAYRAESTDPPVVFTGSLKSVVESAARAINDGGQPGTIQFTAGAFDLGAEWFRLVGTHDITFAGAGMNSTTIQNNTDVAADTEPFNLESVTRLTIRDMTLAARGAPRPTSDVIDFDNGNDSVVERVKIVASRGRGIIFDGKGVGWSAERNLVRDCVVDGTSGGGIELLAASNNTITGCTITDVGRSGIVIQKASSTAATPNKASNDNTVSGNTVDNAGHDGIFIGSSSGNRIIGNTIRNSSNLLSGRDGIRMGSADSVPCDDTLVEDNVATDTQATKTQRWGLNITSSLCHRTIVRGNDFTGNLTGEIRDLGTGTITDAPADTTPPSVPGSVRAGAASSTEVDVTWSASTDNVGVTGYGIYRDGALVASVGASARSYRDTGLSPETTYSYAVDAVDAATNRSDKSAAVGVTTPAAPQPGQATFTPVADTYVDAATPTTPRGTATTLRIDASPDVRSYLRFDVQGSTGSIVSAKLRLWANSSSSAGYRAHGVSDTAWLESMVYADAPAPGPVVASSGAFTSGRYVEVDVTSLVSGDGLVSFAVTGSSSTAVSLARRESVSDPQLVVTFGN
jgi:parallel beta-helix repeat protein